MFFNLYLKFFFDGYWKAFESYVIIIPSFKMLKTSVKTKMQFQNIFDPQWKRQYEIKPILKQALSP